MPGPTLNSTVSFILLVDGQSRLRGDGSSGGCRRFMESRVERRRSEHMELALIIYILNIVFYGADDQDGKMSGLKKVNTHQKSYVL